MIKWFCDVCGAEILPPEHPVQVHAHREGKNRDDAEVGWGESKDIVQAWCHRSCADALESAIKKAIQEVKTSLGESK